MSLNTDEEASPGWHHDVSQIFGPDSAICEQDQMLAVTDTACAPEHVQQTTSHDLSVSYQPQDRRVGLIRRISV
jgi:hypothetical protein